MNKGVKSVLIVLVYLMIYFFSDTIVGLLAGMVYGLKNPSISDNISYDTLFNNVQQFYFNNINLFIIISALIALSIYILVFKIRKRSFIDYVNFSSISPSNIGICSILGISISLFLSSFLMLTSIHELFPSHEAVIDTVIRKQSFSMIFLSIGIIVPIFEEILFRGLIFNELKNNLNLTFAIFAQSLIFGFVHGNTLQIIYTFFGGIILALAYLWLKSIWAPILIHIFWNSTSIIFGRVNFGGQVFNNIIFILSFIFILISIKKLKAKKEDKEASVVYEVDN